MEEKKNRRLGLGFIDGNQQGRCLQLFGRLKEITSEEGSCCTYTNRYREARGTEGQATE